MLQKGVYPYEHMDDWEKFNKTSLPEKEDFYIHLNIEDSTDADYEHAKRVCKDFVWFVCSKFVCSKWYILLAENSKYVSWNIWAWSWKISFSSWISMASNFKKVQSKIRPFHLYQYVINGRKRNKRRNMSYYLLLCKS